MSAIEAFADDLLFRMAASCGELAAELGLTAVGDRRLPAPAIPDFSDETAAERGTMMGTAADALARLAPPASTDEAITGRILRYLLEAGMFGPFAGRAGRSFATIPYPLNHLSGHHPTSVMLLARDAPATTAEDADAALAALAAWPGAIDAALGAFAAHEAAGLTTPRASLVRALGDLEAFVAAAPAENLVIAAYARKLAAALGPAAAEGWSATAQNILSREILPACARQLAVMKGRLAREPGDDGFWRHPDGAAHYAWLLRAHTTTDLEPASVHELGLAETERVQREIQRQFAALGISGGTIAELYAAISGPEHAAFGPGPASRERALTATRALIADFATRSTPMFAAWPKARVEVQLIPPELEGSLPSCYTPPTAGGGRDGLFWLNYADASAKPAWELPVLCAHEAAPGHHVQLALAQEAPLGPFRRAVVFSAYIEGWAKYAETLLDEVLMDDPHVRLGRLRGELYSSANLALDTGIHARRWTRDEAATFFRDKTGVSPAFAETIADRSLVSPGQLCAYKIGMRTFLGLRDRFAGRGDDDLREFHSAVLDQGALPLSVLEEVAGERLETAG